MKLYEQYLIEAGATSILGPTIAGMVGISALLNVYSSYKERVREYGKTRQECVRKCELRYDEGDIKQHPKDYNKEDIIKLRQRRIDCINTCNARYYHEVKSIKEKQKTINQAISKLKKKHKSKEE